MPIIFLSFDSQEFFVSGDIHDFLQNVKELRSPAYAFELVKRSISMSFDRGDRERELLSQAFKAAHQDPDILTSEAIGKGFERLFELIDEFEKDSPFARGMLSIYLARAVVDEILHRSYLEDPVVCNLAGILVIHARALLVEGPSTSELEHIWGPGDGLRPVEELKAAIDQMCQEYLLSKSIPEAVACVKEMNIAHYHHEIFVRAVKCSLKGSIEDQIAMSALLTYLVKSAEVVSKGQCELGFRRVQELTEEWAKECTNANDVVAAFVSRATSDDVL